MEVPYVHYFWKSPMCSLWAWMGIEHWDFHGMVLWVMHWDSMDLHLGLLMGSSMEVLYG